MCSNPRHVRNYTAINLCLLPVFFLFFAVRANCNTGATLPFKKAPVITVTHQCSYITIALSDSVTANICLQQFNNDTLHVKSAKNQKYIAALLSFPLFGIVGLHRIYLGTKPYVPIVYIVTVGGVFGILPLIDFFILLRSTPEQLEQYKNNARVFMWMGK